MGITIYKMFIWGDVSSDKLEKTFMLMHNCKANCDHISDNIPPQMKILNTVIPLIIDLINNIKKQFYYQLT